MQHIATLLGHLGRDFRRAFRGLGKDLVFTIAAVLCIALAVGANSAIFSVLDVLLLRAVPFEEPGRLVSLTAIHEAPGMEAKEYPVSPGDFFAWRERSHAFATMAAVYPRNFNLALPAEGGAENGVVEPERLLGARVSPAFFEVLQVRPLHGRAFAAEEEQPGRERVAILSHSLWQRRFGGELDALGQTLLLDGESYEIIGIMRPRFRYPDDSALWVPQVEDPSSRGYRLGWHFLEPVARLDDGVSLATAQADLQAISHQLTEELPDLNTGWTAEITSLEERLVGDLRPRLLALALGVGFLLLIACANIANLLLARTTVRAKEMAIRSALGGSRGRLIGLMITEGICLAAIGGAVGLGLVRLALPVIARSPLDIPALADVALNGRVVLFTLALILVTGILFSLAPAWRYSRPDLAPVLNEGVRGSSRGGGHRLQAALVIAQVATTVILLVAAGLLARSYRFLQEVDPGFSTDGRLTCRVSIPRSRYRGEEERQRFVDEVVRRLEVLPGIRAAAATTALPVGDRDVDFSASFSVEGRLPTSRGENFTASIRRVTPEYFDALDIELLRGRLFRASDHRDAPGAVIVSQSMARRYWPESNALDRRLKAGDYDSESPWLTVVGVVEDVKDQGLHAELQPMWYRPYTQDATRYVSFILAAEGDPAASVQAVRQAIWSVDSALPVYNLTTLDEVLGQSTAEHRLLTLLFLALAGLGLVLAIIGLYGVMSYLVSQRRHEMGIRIAMGAGTRDVVALVLRRGMILTLVGIALGLAGFWGVRRLLENFLYGVRSTDVPTIVVVVAVLAATALLANLIPARRAARVDPLVVLRSE